LPIFKLEEKLKEFDMRQNYFLSCLAVCYLILLPDLQTTAQSVNIDLSVEHQTIDGFGGINFPGWIPDLNEDQREKAFGNDPGELGLSILRVHIDPEPAMFSRELPTAIYAKEQSTKISSSLLNPPADLIDPNGRT